jgi:hypothetical protein
MRAGIILPAWAMPTKMGDNSKSFWFPGQLEGADINDLLAVLIIDAFVGKSRHTLIFQISL